MSINTVVMEADEKSVQVQADRIARNEIGTELDDAEMETATNVEEFKKVMEPNLEAVGEHYKENGKNRKLEPKEEIDGR